MELDERMQWLIMLKALADDSRLSLVQALSAEERTVGDLAAAIKLGDPTVSHHLSKLHQSGLVSLRTAGNQRFYSLNKYGLKTFKDLASRFETLKALPRPVRLADNWIDELDWSVEDKQILHAHIQGSVLTHLPSKPKRTEVILRWLITRFDPGRMYTELEVNEVLKTVYRTDPVSLRRDLVDFGYLRRERGGGKYWVTPEGEKPVA